MGRNFDLIFLIKLFSRRKYVILVLIAIFLYVFLMKESRAKIYFKTEGVLYIVNESKVFGTSNDVLRMILPDYDFETQKESLVEFMKSPILLERTIVKSGYNAYFHTDKDDYKEDGISIYDWILKVNNIYNLKVHNTHLNYRIANSKVLNNRLKRVTYKIIINNNIIDIFSLSGKKIGFLNLKQNRVYEDSSVRFEIEKIIDTKKVYDEKIFLTIENQNYLAEKIADDISISKSKRTSLVKVFMKGDNPFLIKKFLDTLMKEFINYNIELKFRNIDKIVDYLEKELSKLVTNREEYIRKIYQLEEKYDISISPRTTFELTSSLYKHYMEIDKINLYIEKLKFLKNKLKNNKISKTYISEGDSLFSSITRLTSTLLEEIKKFNLIRLEYTSNSIKYKRQVEQIKKIKEMLSNEIDYKIKDLEVKIDNIKTLMMKYHNKNMINSKVSRRISFYLEEIKIIDGVRKDIYAHLESLMIDRIFIKYGNKIIKEARMPYNTANPIKNKIMINVIKSVVLALILVVLKYFIFPIFYSKMEIPNKDKIIGGIPQISDKMLKNGIIKFSNDNKMLELFRLLMSIIVINNKNVKAILFTSSYPNDGRSFLSMNFAATLALSKKRVVVATIYPISIDTNKTIYNFNEVLDFENKAERIEVDSDTYFYRFYCISKNYDKDIDIGDSDNEVYEIIKKLKTKCDLIIFDCLAYPMYADTFIYAPSCDMVFSVLRLGHTPTKIYGKHLSDLNKYIKDYSIIINSDIVNLNSSGYILEEKGTTAYYKEKIKYFISRL